MKTLAALLILCMASSAFAQVAINNTSALPDPSAMLDVQAHNKGLLVPRMIKMDRLAITAPAPGLLAYQTDDTIGFYYNSAAAGPAVWQRLGDLTLPHAGVSATPDYVFKVTNNQSSAIQGIAASATGENIGVYGESKSANASGTGLYGLGSIGVQAYSNASNGRAVWASALSPTGLTIGVRGFAESDAGTGVFGNAPSATGITYGIKGSVNSPDGYSGHFTGGKFYVEGNTGIGTTTPGNRKLYVLSSGAGLTGVTSQFENTDASGIAFFAKTNSSDGTALFSQSGSGYILRCDGYDPDFFTAFTVKGRRVGINTFDPASALDINGQTLMTASIAEGATLKVSNEWGRAIWAITGSPEPAVYSAGYDKGLVGEATAVDNGSAYGVIGKAHSGAGVYGTVTTTTQGIGIFGEITAEMGDGVRGKSSSVTGSGSGVRGESLAPDGTGVLGRAYASIGQSVGVDGGSSSPNGIGVLGIAPNLGIEGNATATTGAAVGVSGLTFSSSGTGVSGIAQSTSIAEGESAFGVRGEANSTNSVGVFGTSPRKGVQGTATATTGSNYGVEGSNASSGGAGIYGRSSGTEGTGVIGIANHVSGVTTGVRGEVLSPNGFSGYFTGGRFYIQGNTGIGTDNPGSHKLNVTSSSIGTSAATLFAENTNASGLSLMATSNSRDGTALFVQESTGYLLRCDGYDPNYFVAMIVQGRKVGINTSAPTQNLDVNGNARFRSIASGTYLGPVNRTSDGTLTTATSDARLKSNIEPLQNSLEKVLQLQGVSFLWKDKPQMGRRIGFVAQQFEKVLPELSFINPADGFKGINYAEVTAVLVEAVKELKAENELLKARLEKLENRKE
jgi:hypothetical protein